MFGINFLIALALATLPFISWKGSLYTQDSSSPLSLPFTWNPRESKMPAHWIKNNFLRSSHHIRMSTLGEQLLHPPLGIKSFSHPHSHGDLSTSRLPPVLLICSLNSIAISPRGLYVVHTCLSPGLLLQLFWSPVQQLIATISILIRAMSQPCTFSCRPQGLYNL